MRRYLIRVGIIIAALFILFNISLYKLPVTIFTYYRVFAQTVFELNCPAGTTSVQSLQTTDNLTGKLRQNYCVDNSGNVFQNVTGAMTVAILQSIRMADQFTGADCGAKINSADSNLGSTTGEIWVNQNCGLAISTAVNVSFAHTLKFIQGGLYTLSATMQVSGTGGGILGPAPTRVTGGGLGLPVVTIKEANAANLASMVSMNAGDTFFQNIALDGNKANETSGGICLLINKAGGVHATGFTVQNCLTDGIQVLSTSGTLNNESDTFKAYDFISQTNGNDGIKCIATNDMFIGNEFEDFGNANDGIELIDCGAARITHGELSQNTIDNLKIAVTTSPTNGASVNKISNLQFCCSTGHDIFINGWDTATGSIQSQANIIANNTFIGSSVVTDNINPSVLFQDTQNNIFTGNVLTSNAAHRWNRLIQSVDVSSASTGFNVITGNSSYPGSTAGTGTGFPTGGISGLSNDLIYDNQIFGTFNGARLDNSGNLLITSPAGFIEFQPNGSTVFFCNNNSCISAVHLNQNATGNYGGSCAMSAATSCTFSISAAYSSAPICVATQQSATLTGGAVGCTVSGTTVTITSAVANSETWAAVLFGNPN